ncbi:hypothetical protein BU14_1940s0001 [Porphyra umbilicalis]|uniref:Uncharacterized protein n=1 Tax=Porphyra umbilicalis TaxID=2786 RepID=A0A1X6NKA1_PORUM|nr:hypothetical protein BU14_1940s0001 [Porphyra umbilicalis]|eukprot:OSX69034.1 hypothetical protein BU14_1940s0001 [Porphyra umbilicalis]
MTSPCTAAAARWAGATQRSGHKRCRARTRGPRPGRRTYRTRGGIGRDSQGSGSGRCGRCGGVQHALHSTTPTTWSRHTWRGPRALSRRQSKRNAAVR